MISKNTPNRGAVGGIYHYYFLVTEQILQTFFLSLSQRSFTRGLPQIGQVPLQFFSFLAQGPLLFFAIITSP